MALVFAFLLGVANFALHGAVRASGHPLLGKAAWYHHQLARRMTLATEFLLLLAAMLLVDQGWAWAAWIYAGYTALNAVGAWLILSRRV